VSHLMQIHNSIMLQYTPKYPYADYMDMCKLGFCHVSVLCWLLWGGGLEGSTEDMIERYFVVLYRQYWW
jgi:hypothetical protein